MTVRHIAFLRGINVGGRRITGPEMVGIATAAGIEGAASYQASGNLVFVADSPRASIESAIKAAFAEGRQWDIEVFVRTMDELRAAVDAVPFAAAELAERGKPQIGFAHDPVDVSSLSPERDLIASVRTEIYWVPHTGVIDADLQMSDLERVAGSLTVRTLGTIERIIAKFAD